MAFGLQLLQLDGLEAQVDLRVFAGFDAQANDAFEIGSARDVAVEQSDSRGEHGALDIGPRDFRPKQQGAASRSNSVGVQAGARRATLGPAGTEKIEVEREVDDPR